MKTISKLLLFTLLLLLVGLAGVSAADNMTDSQSSDTFVKNEVTSADVIKDTSIESCVETIKENKTIEKNKKTANIKEAASSRTITSSNYDQFFTTKSGMTKSTDLIQSGDVLNLQGTFSNVDFAVDKSGITLTSLNKNAKLLNCTVYVQGASASGSKISNLTIQNSKEYASGIHVNNSKNLVIQDNTVKVNGPNSFAFAADGMTHSNVKFNHFETYCRDDVKRSHSAFTIGLSYYNTIANNTVKSDQANCIYLSSYGSGYFKGGPSDYNNITGNDVTGGNTPWSNTIQIMGKGNIISHNTVRGGFKGISTQDNINNVISYNDVSATSIGIYACEKATVSRNNVHVSGDAIAISVGGDGVKVNDNTVSTVDSEGIEISASNVNIANNEITSTNSYGIYSKGQYNNIIIESNKIKSKQEGILFKKQSSTKKINNVKVNANHINSEGNYAINFEEAGAVSTSDINITVTESNVLSSAKGTGLKVAYLKPSNSNGNPDSSADTNQKITVTSSNYDEWFDEGVANIKVKQNATVTLSGTFNNCNFIFNKKVHVIGKNCVINHGTITLSGDAHASTITGITVKNNKKDVTIHAIEVFDVNNCKISNVKISNYGAYESLGIFLHGANANTVSNATITTSGDYINNAILAFSSDSNTFENNRITVNQSNVKQGYDQSIMFNEKIGTIKEVLHNHGIILLYSSYNTINKNTVKATSMFKSYTAPSSTCQNSIVGIDIYFDSHNNKVTSNNVDITSYGPFAYGMGVLGGQWGSSITSSNATGNTFKSNTVKVTGGYFATGFIAGRNSVSTSVDSNKFTIKVNKKSANCGDYSHGITLENSTQSTVSKNTISTAGSALYSIELFDSGKNTIINNTITGSGTHPYAVAGYRATNNKITNNKITMKKVNYGQTSSAKHSDVIPAGDEAIMLMDKSTKNTVSGNIISTNATYAVKLADQTQSNTVTDNSLKSKSRLGDKAVQNSGKSNSVNKNFVHTVSLSVKDISAYLGDTITLTANVKSSTTDYNNLTVTFKLGTNTIGTSKVTNGKATLKYKVSTIFKATTYTITASAKGTNFQNATTKAKATFTKAPVKTVVKVAKVLGTVGSKAVLTANITTTSGGKIGSGKAIFYLDNKVLAIRNVKLGKASYTYSISSKAANKVHTVKVVYNGTKDYAKSSGTNKLGIQTKSAITLSSHTATLGKAVTIKATVKSGNKAVKSGKVIIKINNKQVATAKVSNGKVSYKYTVPSSMNKGTYNLQIVYNGNDTLSKASKTAKIKINPFKPVFHYTTTKAKVGKTVSVVLKIDNGATGSKKCNANGGAVSIKLNGKTLKDSNGKVISGSIKNGKITFKFTAPKELSGYQKLTFSYAGNSKFAAATQSYSKALLIQ